MPRPIPDHLRNLLYHPVPAEVAQRFSPDVPERRCSELKLFIERFIREQETRSATEAILLDILRVEKLPVATPELVRFLMDDLQDEARVFLRKDGVTWGVEAEAPTPGRAPQPENRDLGPRHAINLTELLIRVHRREASVHESALRRACLLAKHRYPELTADQQATLEAVGDGRASLDVLPKEGQLRNVVDGLFKRSLGEVRTEEARRLGTTSYREVAWEITLARVYKAAMQSSPDYYCNPSFQARILSDYCNALQQGGPPEDDPLRHALQKLEAENFTDELLKELWEACPGEAELMRLPSLAGRVPTAPRDIPPNQGTDEEGPPRESIPAASAATPREDAPHLPTLGTHDRQAYQLSLLQGLKQEEVARKLNEEHGTTYSQGQISRMIARMQLHAEVSGLAGLLAPETKPERAVDPSRLELGPRTDKRPPDKRASRDSA